MYLQKFKLNCAEVLDALDYDEEAQHFANLPFAFFRLCFFKLRLYLHLLFCNKCAAQKRKLKMAKGLSLNTFMNAPPAGIADSVMGLIYKEALSKEAAAGEASIKGWVIAGIFVVLSLVSAYFGNAFNFLANIYGLSSVVPAGITIGVVITVYSAIFIGSHMDALCKKFGF